MLYYVICGILVHLPGMESMPPALEVWSPNHWPARKVTNEIKIFYL